MCIYQVYICVFIIYIHTHIYIYSPHREFEVPTPTLSCALNLVATPSLACIHTANLLTLLLWQASYAHRTSDCESIRSLYFAELRVVAQPPVLYPNSPLLALFTSSQEVTCSFSICTYTCTQGDRNAIPRCNKGLSLFLLGNIDYL